MGSWRCAPVAIFSDGWNARAAGSSRSRGERRTYNPDECFKTFPFPEPTDRQRDEIAAAAAELNRLRENWLNPPEWTRQEILTFPGSIDGPWARYVRDPNPAGVGTVLDPRLLPIDDRVPDVNYFSPASSFDTLSEEYRRSTPRRA